MAPPPDLRGKVEAAVMAEIEASGMEAFNRDGIMRAFKGKGASPATLYRWVSDTLKSGMPAEHFSKRIRAAEAEKAKAEAKAAGLPEPPPPPPEPMRAVMTIDRAHASGAAIPIIEKLMGCIRSAEKVIAHAEHEDGKVKAPRLLLTASEHLRRTLETAVRLQEAMADLNHIEQFHAAILSALRDVDPDLERRAIARLREVHSQWGRM
jgi:hypothetical protein